MGAELIWIGRCDKEKKKKHHNYFPFKNPLVDLKKMEAVWIYWLDW